MAKRIRSEREIEANRIRAKAWRENNKARCVEQALKANLRQFGMTIECYEKMVAEQGNVCAICKHPERTKNRTGEIKRLSVDHCWRSGKVRGLLCIRCNTSLGNFNDDIELLTTAIDYLAANHE